MTELAYGQRPRFFQAARGGVLFLDEIGEAPPEVQIMLLRALETGEVCPVGAKSATPVHLRIIAATDADLEAANRLNHRSRTDSPDTPSTWGRLPNGGMISVDSDRSHRSSQSLAKKRKNSRTAYRHAYSFEHGTNTI